MPKAPATPRARTNRPVRVLARGAVAAVLGAVVAGLLVAPASWGAPLPTPKSVATAPVVVEAMQPYAPQTSCDPTLKSGVKKFRDLMLKTYDRGTDGGSTRSCTAGGTSEHYEGRAWDFMLSASNKEDKATADALIAWLLKVGPDGKPAYEARRFGIMYVMYNKKIWGTWDGKWKAIKSGDMHTSHIHFSFSWAGAKGRTSFWTGKVAAFDYGPCRVYKNQPAPIYTKPNYLPCAKNLLAAPGSTHKLAWTGSRTKDVATAQALLKVPAAKRTATFGATVRKAVVAYQKAKKLPVTGALDKATWVSLDPRSRTATAPPATTTGNATSGKPAASSWVTVRSGSTGAGVLVVQKALKLPAAACTSVFDATTLAAVKQFQTARKLVVDGIVGPKTAQALGLVA